MYSRWYHPPKLHSPAPGHTKKVGWIELFYDLIYVASIIQLGNGLSAKVGLGGFLAFAALFTPLWLAWSSFTFYMNRFMVDDFIHRLWVFLQMFAVGAVAIAVPRVMLHEETRNFAIAFGTVRLAMGMLYLRTHNLGPTERRIGLGGSKVLIAEAMLWYASAAMPQPWVYIAWGIAVVMAIVSPLSRRNRELTENRPPDVVHFTERYGLLVIIVLGESFVKVLSELAATGYGIEIYMMGCGAMLVTCTLWWIYFDDVAGSRIKEGNGNRFVWIYAHLPLTLGVTAVGVAVKKVAMLPADLPAPSTKYYWLLCGSLALAIGAVALVDMVTERRQAEVSDTYTIRVRVFSALAILLVPIVSSAMPAWGFVAMVLVFCIGQVLMDMVLAPEAMDQEELHHAEHRELERYVVVEEEAASGKTRRKSPKDIGTPVRRGAPNELRRDFYFFVIEGSWGRFFGFTAVMYLLINVVFAALYLLEPGSVEGVEPGDFPEAFFFSVQTLSTIGYGGMVPLTDYGNVIMTLEAGVGVLVVALTTGLMFAKASHPHSSVLFSNVGVVTQYHGEPTLMLRAGNARGNDVVEAAVTVSALVSEVSPEGHEMRRIYDVPLERKMSPLFSLSWTIMHKITPDSPLYGCQWGAAVQSADEDTEHDGSPVLLGLIVTMLGHDSVYGQTTHARHMYSPQDIRVGHSFVDVMSRLDDGRLMIDYAPFHDTTPDDQAKADAVEHSLYHPKTSGEKAEGSAAS